MILRSSSSVCWRDGEGALIISDMAAGSFEDNLKDAEVAHGHLCAGQVLGVRMAMCGLKKLGIEDPRGKRG